MKTVLIVESNLMSQSVISKREIGQFSLLGKTEN